MAAGSTTKRCLSVSALTKQTQFIRLVYRGGGISIKVVPGCLVYLWLSRGGDIMAAGSTRRCLGEVRLFHLSLLS